MPAHLIYVYYVALPILWARIRTTPVPNLFITRQWRWQRKKTKQRAQELWWLRKEHRDWQLIFHSAALSIVNYLFSWHTVLYLIIHSFAFRIQEAFTTQQETLQMGSIMSLMRRTWLIENKPGPRHSVSATKQQSHQLNGKNWKKKKTARKAGKIRKIRNRLRRLLMPISVQSQTMRMHMKGNETFVVHHPATMTLAEQNQRLAVCAAIIFNPPLLHTNLHNYCKNFSVSRTLFLGAC